MQLRSRQGCRCHDASSAAENVRPAASTVEIWHDDSCDCKGNCLGSTRAILCSGAGLKLDPGRIVAFVGRNGSGESTLLRALARLHEASSGTVSVRPGDGEAVHSACNAAAITVAAAKTTPPVPRSSTSNAPRPVQSPGRRQSLPVHRMRPQRPPHVQSAGSPRRPRSRQRRLPYLRVHVTKRTTRLDFDTFPTVILRSGQIIQSPATYVTATDGRLRGSASPTQCVERDNKALTQGGN